MKRLIYLFIVITCVSLPVMFIYHHNVQQGTAELENPGFKANFHKITLGNMGGAQTQCLTKRLEFDDTNPVLDL